MVRTAVCTTGVIVRVHAITPLSAARTLAVVRVMLM